MRCCPALRSAEAGQCDNGRVPTARLSLWSEARGEWASCPPDEITWLDRRMLSGNADLTLHRAPRCAGLRYVHHRWELFSRDATYRVYLAPEAAGTPVSAEAVQRTASHVLPAAPAAYEALPVALAEGTWLVSVGKWVLRLRLDVLARRRADPVAPDGDKQPTTRASDDRAAGQRARRRRGGSRRGLLRAQRHRAADDGLLLPGVHRSAWPRRRRCR